MSLLGGGDRGGVLLILFVSLKLLFCDPSCFVEALAENEISFLVGNIYHYTLDQNEAPRDVGRCEGYPVYLDYSHQFNAVVAVCSEANHAFVRTFPLLSS